MTRCCVPGCDSGTFKEVKRTRAAGLRVKSFFTFPKNEELFKKWIEIIFQNKEDIVEKPKICELHFNDSDILKYYETVLKDGTIHRIQRQRHILRNGAVPILSNEKKMEINKTLPENSVNNPKSKVVILQNQLLNTKNKFEVNSLEKLSNNSGISDQQICKSNLNTKVTDNYKNINIQTNVITDININEREIDSAKNRFETDEIITKSIKQYNIKPNIQRVNKNDTTFTKINDHQKKNLPELQNDNNTEIDNIVFNKENYIKKKEDSIQGYNFLQLKKDLQNKSLNISSSWSYAFQENSSVTFAYVHPLKFIIQLFCIIDSNMNIKIATYDRRVNIDIDIKFNTSTDFVNYLSKLEKTKCCDGTGIKNSFSKKCQGFISSNEEYKRSRGYQRCAACREFRRITLRREDNPIDIELRMREQNRKIKALQFKCNELQKLLFVKTKTSEE